MPWPCSQSPTWPRSLLIWTLTLTQFSSLTTLDFLIAADVSNDLADPVYCHWTCSARFAQVPWDGALVREGTALPALLSPLTPGIQTCMHLPVYKSCILELFFSSLTTDVFCHSNYQW